MRYALRIKEQSSMDHLTEEGNTGQDLLDEGEIPITHSSGKKRGGKRRNIGQAGEKSKKKFFKQPHSLFPNKVSLQFSEP